MKGKLSLVGLVSMVAMLAVLLAPMVAVAAPPTPGSVAEGPPMVAAPPRPSQPATVTAVGGLRLRHGPSLYDRVILVLRRGETVYPAGGPVWGSGISWTYVIVYRYGFRYEGFCATNYLSNTGRPDPGPDPKPGPGPGPGPGPIADYRVRVTAPGGLRLRTGPSVAYRIQRVVSYGTVLRATDVTRWGSGIQWREVVVGHQRLWAAAMYLRPA